MKKDNPLKPKETAAPMTQRRLQHLLTASPAVIYSCQPYAPYTATFISDNLQAQLGYTPQDFLHDPNFWFDHVHPEDRALVLTKLTTLFEQDELQYEYRFQHQDGRYCWMLDDQRLIRDKAGSPLEIVGYWIDITERKQAEETLRQHKEFLQTILDRIPVMIVCFDAQSQLQWANCEWERVVGWSLEEATQRDILAELYPDPDYRQQVLHFIQEAHTRWGDFRTQVRDGRVLETTWANVKLSDGSHLGIG